VTGAGGLDLRPVRRTTLAVGVAAVAAAAVGAVLDPGAFFRAYLVGYLFWLGIALGCLAIVMLHHLSGGAWGLVLRRIAESATGTLPVLAVLFVPVAVGVPALYAWARPEAAGDPLLAHKAVWLNVPFFLARAVLYFAVWIAVAAVLNRWSAARDRRPDPYPRRFRLLAGPGLVLYGLTVSLAAIDWGMSLEPHWYSTVYPLLFGVGQVLTAFAFAITVALLLGGREPFARLLAPRTLIDLGNLLLTFVLLWAYLAFSQFMLIWAANLREEVTWYVARERGPWLGVAITLIVVHFALPFALLLHRRVKRTPGLLAAVAVLVLAMRLLDVCWLILPAGPPAAGFSWLYVVVPTALGGLWLTAFVHQLDGRPLVPLHDPAVEEAMAHGA
jgi:hypothetical protein